MARMRDSHRNPETNRSVVAEVVERVAEKEGISPTDLQPPLYDVIDPEALTCLFHGSQTLIRIDFEYRDWNIELRPDEISVTSRPSEE